MAAPPTAAPSAPVPAPLLATAAELAQLRQEVADLRRELMQLREAPTRQTLTAGPIPSAPDPRVDSSAREQAPQAERERVQSREAAFQGERSDAAWSRATAVELRTLIAQADESVGHHVRSIDCRARTCRVEIDAAASPRLTEALPLLMSRLASILPQATGGQIDQGDGRRATVLYLSR